MGATAVRTFIGEGIEQLIQGRLKPFSMPARQQVRSQAVGRPGEVVTPGRPLLDDAVTQGPLAAEQARAGLHLEEDSFFGGGNPGCELQGPKWQLREASSDGARRRARRRSRGVPPRAWTATPGRRALERARTRSALACVRLARGDEAAGHHQARRQHRVEPTGHRAQADDAVVRRAAAFEHLDVDLPVERAKRAITRSGRGRGFVLRGGGTEQEDRAVAGLRTAPAGGGSARGGPAAARRPARRRPRLTRFGAPQALGRRIGLDPHELLVDAGVVQAGHVRVLGGPTTTAAPTGTSRSG